MRKFTSIFRAALVLALILPTRLVFAANAYQQIADLGTCHLENGQNIDKCRIGYRTVGMLNPDRSNAILFPTWFNGNSESLLPNADAGKMLDANRWFVIFVDALGDGISSSPSNSATQPRMKFPQFSIRDMVDIEYRLVTETLHLKHLRAVIGISMGGMQTFEWALRYPEFMDLAVPIEGSPQLTSTDLLLWTAELHALQDSVTWHEGNYGGNPPMPTVMDIHQFALTTPEYRAANPGRARFKEYLDQTEGDFVDWNNWYRQLQAMIGLDIARQWGGSLAEAVKHLKAKMLIVVSEQDHMVNPIPGLEFAKMARQQTLVLHGSCGHLAAPSCELAQVDSAVRRFLAGDFTAGLSATKAFGAGTTNLTLTVASPSSNCGSGVQAPVPVFSVGFNHLVFCDDFDSASTIDVNATGNPGYSWYTKLPFGGAQTLPSAYSVSNSVLTVTSTGWTGNWALTTRDPITGNGNSWIYGYFEARIKFDPTLGPNSRGWPSFWSLSAYHTQFDNKDIWSELDFFEAYTAGFTNYSGAFVGTLHDWRNGGSINYQNSNNWQPQSVNWNQWHTIACLWTEDKITWYLDGKALMSQGYSATAPPNPLANSSGGTTPTPAGVFDIIDTQSLGIQLIVGSSPGWPMNVDWVRVWHN